MFTYNALCAYRKKHNLTTEEAVDALLSLAEKRDRSKRERIKAARNPKHKPFVYHGKAYKSLAHAVRVAATKNDIFLSEAHVYAYSYRHKVSKEIALDKYIEIAKKEKYPSV